MICSEFSRKVDVDAEIFMTQLKTLYAAGDKNAHTFKLMLCRKGAPLDIGGAGVIGYFIRSDGSTVLLSGEVDENVVTLTLDESCYAVIGQYNLIIKITIDDERKAVFWGNGYITRSQTDKIIDSGDVVPSLEELLAQIAAVEAAAKDARAAAKTATAAASKIDTMTVTATGLDAGAAPTAELTKVDGRYNLAFGVPKGDKGEPGDIGPQGPQGEKGEPGKDAPQEAVLYTAQELDDAQKAQARVNVGAADAESVSRLKDDLGGTNNGLSSFDILKYAGLVISNTETDVEIEPNTKYEIILKSEKDTNLIIRTRKKDKSYSKNYTLDLHANEVKKTYITSAEDEYYFRLGQSNGTEENYFIAFRKFIDIDKMRSDIDELISFDLSGLISEVNETKDGLADCKLSKSNLYTDATSNFEYGDFKIGKPNNPGESINESITYVGTIYADLTKDMVVKTLSTDYDYAIAKTTDAAFTSWKNKETDTVIEENASYVICVRSNSYKPFSTIAKDVKENFKIENVYHTLKYVDKYRFDVKEYGAIGDGTTGDSFAIQKVLDIAKTEGNVCVYFPKGTYYIESTLQYYPNTEFIMHPDAVILRDEKASPILTNSSLCGDDVPCYSNGYLRIKGGVFKGTYPSGNTVYRLIGLQCGKLSELTIEDVSFIDACAGNHLIDISGCNNVTIRNNKIVGMHLQHSLRPTTPNGDTEHVASLEMVQIDVGEGLGVGTNEPYDLIPTKNVVIEGNEFMANTDNEESVLYRPIGIHMNPYEGYYYENIRINDNSFKNVLGRCIGISGVKQVEICRNTFSSDLAMIDDLIKLSLFVGTLARDSKNIKIEDNVCDMESDTYNFFKIYTGGSTEPYMSFIRLIHNYAPNLGIVLENANYAYLLQNVTSSTDYSTRCSNVVVV